MSAFRALRDVSNNFENELEQFSASLFSAKIVEKFEDALTKKLQDMTLFSSKLKLLHATQLASTSQIKEQPLDNALQDYGDAALWKVLEHMTVKSLTQAHSVKALITASHRNMAPELIERKESIIEALRQYSHKESELCYLAAHIKEREAELEALRAEWDTSLGTLRDLREQRNSGVAGDRGPLYSKLTKLVDKLELMRWLVGRLVCSRGQYDWLADPHRRLSALRLTRDINTVDMFTQDAKE